MEIWGIQGRKKGVYVNGIPQGAGEGTKCCRSQRSYVTWPFPLASGAIHFLEVKV